MSVAFMLTTLLRVLRRIVCICFCSRAIVVVVAFTEIGYFIKVGGERKVRGRIRFICTATQS